MKELNLKLSIKEVNLILEALATQPYLRVFDLIEQIQQQAKEQLNGAAHTVGLTHDGEQQESKAVSEALAR